MKVTVQNVVGRPYQNVMTARQHSVLMDATPASKGGDTGPSPHEMLLGALGGCTSMTMAMYAARKGMDLKDIKIEVEETQVPNPNGSGTIPSLNKRIEVKGNLSAAELADLHRVAEKCPVNKVIKGPNTGGSTINLVV